MSFESLPAKESPIITFYRNKLKANNKKGYLFTEILNWSDYELEIEHDFIQWLFPDETGGVNVKAPKLTKNDVKIFRTDIKIRKNVFKATERMLNFYGYTFSSDSSVKQIKDIERKEKGIHIGLYSKHNYRRLSRMMIFLNRIDMKRLSSLIMLFLCKALKKDSGLRKKVIEAEALKYWFETQKYLFNYRNNYDINSSINLQRKKLECKFTGLKYTGNSCYQDSALLSLFAIPIQFISENILYKDLFSISGDKNREIHCGKDEKDDYQKRKAIQEELLNITNSMRNRTETEYCSNLRSLLKFCPSSSKQKFYGTGMQDTGEFIQYLFSIFQVGGLFFTRKTIITNDLFDPAKHFHEKTIKQESSPLVLIPSDLLSIHKEKINIDYFLNQVDNTLLDKNNLYRGPDGKMYKRIIQGFSVIKTDFLIFYTQRIIKKPQNVSENSLKRLYTKIVPNEEIILGKKLYLYSIIVHKNAHYTCYIKCEDNWFYYDDTSENIEYIGDYSDMINEENRPNVLTRGILYFYKV